MRKLKQQLGLILLVLMAPLTMASELVIEITSGVDDPVPVAIVPFDWVGNKALPVDVAMVVESDLERSGQFKALQRGAMLSRPRNEETVFYRDWRYLATEYLVIGQVLATEKGFTVEYQLFDIENKQIISRGAFTGGRDELRGLAHNVSDAVYEVLTGLKGAFSTRVAYVAADRKVNPSFYKLMMADADGFNRKVLLESDQPIMSPNWSRDAQKLAYVSFEKNRPEIFIIDVDTNERIQLKSYPGLNGAPAWSPDGKKLAIVLSKDGNAEIYVFNLEDRSLQRVTNHYGIDTEPSWSVDGKSIIFTSDRGGKPQIYQVDLSTKWVERLTFEGDYNARGSLTYDGRFLVLVSRHDGRFHIAVQDLKRGTMTKLTRSSLDESPSVAPNGSMVLYATEVNGKDILAAVSIDGQVTYQLPAASGVVREPAWSPYLN